MTMPMSGGTKETINCPNRDFNWAFQKYKTEPNGLVSVECNVCTVSK